MAKMNGVDPQAWSTDILASPASPPIRLIGWINYCPGIGRLRLHSSPLKRHDHARQQGSSRHHHYSGRQGPRRRRRLVRDVANEMEIEDGVIWVYGVGEDGVQAFTEFGIENLIEFVRMHKHKHNPKLLRR
jgi:hypothetical protein